jgi:hypothetical protein
VEAINEGLLPLKQPLRLDTPRAALESYLDAIRRHDFGRAAAALNLNAIPVEQQSEWAPQLALMLAFNLRRHDLIQWAEIPDQPDARVLPGYSNRQAPTATNAVAQPWYKHLADGRCGPGRTSASRLVQRRLPRRRVSIPIPFMRRG